MQFIILGINLFRFFIGTPIMIYKDFIASHRYYKDIAELHYLSHKTSFRDFADENWIENRDLNGYVEFWDNYLVNQNPKERTWVSLDGEQVIGTITIMSLENCSDLFQPSDISDSLEQDVACLRLMYINPLYFRQGIGSQLIKKAHEYMQDNQYQRAVLITHAANSRARSFYEKMGWVLDALINEQVKEFFHEPPIMRSRARYQILI